MDNRQKINCTVSSCIYNNSESGLCNLKSIVVTPKTNVHNGTPDESQCSSYENQ